MREGSQRRRRAYCGFAVVVEICLEAHLGKAHIYMLSVSFA